MSGATRYNRLEEEQEVTKPHFLARYEGRRSRLGRAVRGNRGANYGFTSEEEYRFAKRVSWALAYKKLFDAIDSEAIDPASELSQQIGTMRQSLQEVFTELDNAAQALYSNPSRSPTQEEILARVPNIDVQLVQIEEGFPKLVQQAGVRVNGAELSGRDLESSLHNIERDETFLQLTPQVRGTSARAFSSRVLTRELNSAVNDFQQTARSESRASEAETRSLSYRSESREDTPSPTLSIDEDQRASIEPDIQTGNINDLILPEDLRALQQDTRTVAEHSALVTATAPRAFERLNLTAAEIDDLVEADLAALTSMGTAPREVGGKELNADDKAKATKAYRKTLNALYTTIKRYVESDRFVEKPEGVVDRIDEWVQEHLNRKLTDDERSVFKHTVGTAAKQYRDSLNDRRHPVARVGMAAAAFIGNVVYTVTLVGPVVQALRGKSAAEIMVPEILMQCYDPTTKTNKSLFAETDKQLLRTIRGENLGQKTYSGRGSRQDKRYVPQGVALYNVEKKAPAADVRRKVSNTQRGR